MEFGAHLPLMDFGGHPFTLDHLTEYVRTAAALGFDAVSANDHLVFSVPWLDGPTALAAVIEHSGTMTLATTVALPVVRGPVVLAKTLAAIDRLSGGRVMVAVGPGSSPLDYQAVGVDFEERWARFDESIGALRSLWRVDAKPFVGSLLHDRRARLGAASHSAPRACPSGSAAGARMQASGEPRASVTAGSRPRTTSHLHSSMRPGRSCMRCCPRTARTRRRSRTRWRPCGATSPTAAPRPTA